MTDLVVAASGEGPALLWGHGLMTSMAAEDRQGPIRWPELDLPVRLVRWDARGHGESPGGAKAQVRWDALADDLLDVADEVGADRFLAGGASMGAATAISAALAAPGRVRGLVLALPPSAWARRVPVRAVYGAAGAVGGVLPFRPARRRGVALRGAAASDLPPIEQIATIDVPTLILAWRFDPVHPVAIAEQLAEVMPQAELHVSRRIGMTDGWIPRLREFVARFPN